MTGTSARDKNGWLVFLFSLPSNSASKRVDVWRKLRKYGVLALKSSGYILPKSGANEERLQWLAADIRKYKGTASVLHVSAIDTMPAATLVQMFNAARNDEYEAVAKQLSKSPARNTQLLSCSLRQFQEIVDRDFFQAPGRRRIEQILFRLSSPSPAAHKTKMSQRKNFAGKTWLTRPRPGIDRVSSAWLIRRFIDPAAKFAFGATPSIAPHAIPFDMFVEQGFSHRGEDCTFETLVKEFAITDRKVKSIAQIIHDADISDGKFGRSEALGLDKVLTGWANQGISDHELLRRGIDLIEGLYDAI